MKDLQVSKVHAANSQKGRMDLLPIRPFLSGLILIDFLYALGGQCMTVLIYLWAINRRLLFTLLDLVLSGQV